jgi:membrane protease YdiL (CAAX protease family)
VRFAIRRQNTSPKTVTTFQQTALLLTAIWLLLVVVRFRRSIMFFIGGLLAIGLYTLVTISHGDVTLDELGLGIASSWLPTIGLALAWLALMVAYSPLADWLATRWVAQPPTLEAFRAIQQSRTKLIAGIVVAWVLGGVLEELVLRGIVLQSVNAWLTPWVIEPIATGIAVCAAALGGGVLHFYQGPRAMVIITQLSVLFGVLFVVSGYNLWAVMLCHGLYDTIAFVRFANKKSKYSDLDSK